LAIISKLFAIFVFMEIGGKFKKKIVENNDYDLWKLPSSKFFLL